MSIKNPTTPSGIEPVTFRLVYSTVPQPTAPPHGQKLTRDLHQLTGHQGSVLLESVTECFLTFQTNVVPPSSRVEKSKEP
jgi:hypothetical protein